MNGIARMMMTAGGVIFLIGAVLWAADALGLSIGRLPGEISYEGKDLRVYAPIATSVVVSVVLTIVLNIIARFRK